jgi:putative PEP-CTERM system TPR-repeat lipoprotein
LVRASQPRFSEARLQRADEQIASGAYRSAIIELKNVLVNNSENVRARLMLAEVSLGLGDLETAEKEMQRAAELGAPESDIRPLHLRILAAKNQYSEMLAALGMDTGGLTDAEQLAFKGQALLGLRNADVAEATYREWLALDPGSTDAEVGLARSVAIAGNTTDAITSLQAVIADNPGHVGALLTLGSLYFRVGDYTKSEIALIDAIAHSLPQSNINRHVRINAALIESQLALGKNEDARRNLEGLSSIVPQSPVTLFLAARLARTEQDYALAARHLQMLLNVSPENGQAQLFLANMHMMQGNYAQAEMLLNRVVSNSPDNIQARKLLAQVQLRQAQPQGAVEALAPLLDQSAEDADVYTLLAQIGLQQGDTQSVIQNLRAAAESAPDDMEIRLNLAAAYLNIGEVDLGTEVLATVLESGNGNYRRQQLQLFAFLAQGKNADAEQYAAELLRQHGDESKVILIVSDHFLKAGDSSRARQILSRFVGRNPEIVETSLFLARLELADGNIDTAKALFSAVQAIESNNLVAFLGLARVAEVGGDHDKALSILETASAAHTDAVGPRVWLASRYLGVGRLNDAENMANELTAIGYRNSKISEIVGRVFVEAGRLDEAIVQFEFAAELDPTSPSIRLNAAQTYLAIDRTVEARESLNQALEIRPGWMPAKTLLTLVELRQGQVDAALRHVAELRVANPDNASVMVLEGEVLLYQEDYVNAAAALHRAVRHGAGRRAMLREFQARTYGGMPDPEEVLISWLQANSDDTGVRTTLAQYYLQTGSGDKAIRELEAVLQVQPDNAVLLNNLAWQYQQVGNLSKALEIATKAYEIEDQSGAIADTLAWIYRDLGQLDISLELLGDAIRLSPDNGEIRFHMATVLVETGNEEEARRILQELVTRNIQFPSRARAEELLERL